MTNPSNNVNNLRKQVVDLMVQGRLSEAFELGCKLRNEPADAPALLSFFRAMNCRGLSASRCFRTPENVAFFYQGFTGDVETPDIARAKATGLIELLEWLDVPSLSDAWFVRPMGEDGYLEFSLVEKIVWYCLSLIKMTPRFTQTILDDDHIARGMKALEAVSDLPHMNELPDLRYNLAKAYALTGDLLTAKGYLTILMSENPRYICDQLATDAKVFGLNL